MEVEIDFNCKLIDCVSQHVMCHYKIPNKLNNLIGKTLKLVGLIYCRKDEHYRYAKLNYIIF